MITIKVKDKVQELLEKYPHLRDSDEKLTANIWLSETPKGATAFDFLQMYAEKNMGGSSGQKLKQIGAAAATAAENRVTATQTPTQGQSTLEVTRYNAVTEAEFEDTIFYGSTERYNKDGTINYGDSAIASYTGEDYATLNSVLGGYYQGKPSAALKKQVQNSEKVLNKALDQIPSKAGTTYRGMSDAKLKSQLLGAVGGEVQFKGFSSTSKNRSTADNFSGYGKDKRVMMVIKGKNGKPIENLSSFKREKEILFKSNSKFKIDKYDSRTDTFYLTEIGG